MQLREYAATLRENWVLVMLMTILGLGAGTGYSLFTPPEYQSHTQIFISARPQAGDTWELLQGAEYSSQVISSYVSVAGTDAVLEPVVDRLGLEMTGPELAAYVDARSPRESASIEIFARSSSPEQAAEIADAVGESLKEVIRTQVESEYETGAGLVALTTTQEAKVPEAPESPDRVLDMTLGFVLGFLVGYGLSLLRRVRSTRIRTVPALEELTGLPVIGGILDDPACGAQPLTLRSRPQSPRAESFRALRTNFLHLVTDLPGHSYVITSVNQGEGASTTALNLAIALSRAGRTVAVVDADLRSPSHEKYLGIERGVGLTEVLTGTAGLEDAIRPWRETGLHVLPAGRSCPDPGELLASAGMEEVLQSLHQCYDHVIIDVPSVHEATDAMVLGGLTSGVLLIAAAGSTTEKSLQSALLRLGTSGGVLLGIVLTHLSRKQAAGHLHEYPAQPEQQAKPGESPAGSLHAG